MQALRFTVTCLECGGAWETVNPGGTGGSTTKIIVRCVDCNREYLVTATQTVMGRHARRHD
jgi:hypothetical protein